MKEVHNMAEKSPEHDPYRHELEMLRKREEWEARKRAEAKHLEGEKKRAELASYLERRGEEWAATTGEQPTLDDLAAWRREYMAEKENEYQRERQKKLEEAERLSGF
jgi:hypothetical protein